MFEIDGHERRNIEPMGGWAWLQEHRHDHTHAGIDALSIVVGADGRMLPPVNSTDKKGAVKTIVRGLR